MALTPTVRVLWSRWRCLAVNARMDPLSFVRLLETRYLATLGFDNGYVRIEFPDEDLKTQFVLTWL